MFNSIHVVVYIKLKVNMQNTKSQKLDVDLIGHCWEFYSTFTK